MSESQQGRGFGGHAQRLGPTITHQTSKYTRHDAQNPTAGTSGGDRGFCRAPPRDDAGATTPEEVIQ